MQTNQPHREEETRNTYSRMTASRQQPALFSLAEWLQN